MILLGGILENAETVQVRVSTKSRRVGVPCRLEFLRNPILTLELTAYLYSINYEDSIRRCDNTKTTKEECVAISISILDTKTQGLLEQNK